MGDNPSNQITDSGGGSVKGPIWSRRDFLNTGTIVGGCAAIATLFKGRLLAAAKGRRGEKSIERRVGEHRAMLLSSVASW